jgi:hypothetical protein
VRGITTGVCGCIPGGVVRGVTGQHRRACRLGTGITGQCG